MARGIPIREEGGKKEPTTPHRRRDVKFLMSWSVMRRKDMLHASRVCLGAVPMLIRRACPARTCGGHFWAVLWQATKARLCRIAEKGIFRFLLELSLLLSVSFFYEIHTLRRGTWHLAEGVYVHQAF